MAVSVDQFGKAAIASGLLTADEVKHVWAEIPLDKRAADGASFARLLVEHGLLTEYQAAQVLAGRGSSLVFGEYVVLQPIGAGGMGQVFKAEHRRMKRIVALKVMSSAAMKDESSVKRFQREVEAAAKLEHPNIVTAYDAGRAGNVNFLVMQFVDGGDLSGLVKKQGPLAVERAVNYIVQAARGLAYAHSEGVIHRDIKPANLLCDKKGVVKILDMGLARLEKGDDGLTATEQVMGTVDYMSPEQASNTKTADARSDIYSLGCTLWYLLTGRKAYDGDSMIQRLMAHREQPLPSLVRARDDAPWPLEQALHKMIAKRASDRFQTMDEVVAALEPFAGDARSAAPGTGSSIGMGSGPHNAELSAFLRTVGPGGKSQATSTSQATTPPSATAQFTQPTIGGDAKQGPKPSPQHIASNGPPVKRIAAGIGVAAVLAVAAFFIFRGGDEENGPPPTNTVAIVPKPAPPAAPSSSVAVPGFSLSSTKGAPISFLATDSSAPKPPPGDYAVSFAESGEVSVPTLNIDSFGPVTIECWVRQTHDRKQGPNTLLGINKRLWIALERNDTTPALHAFVEANLPTTNALPPPARDRRVHIAGVRSGNQTRLYVDGKLAGTRDAVNGPLGESKQVFIVGRNFPGLVDQVRVSKTARYDKDFTPAEKLPADVDTLALFYFDEGYGTVVQDASGHGHVGQVLGAKWVQADGSPVPSQTTSSQPSFLGSVPPGNRFGLRFDGIDDYVEIPGVEVAPDGSPPLTVEAVIFLEQSPDGPTDVYGRYGQLRLWVDDRLGLTSVAYRPAAAEVFSRMSPGVIPIGRPVHVACVWEGSSLRTFVDGGSPSISVLGKFRPDPPAVPFMLGCARDEAGQRSAFFHGRILDLRISKIARYVQGFSATEWLTADADTTALYNFDEGAGDVLHDVSGHGRDGKIVGAQWVQADGSPVPPPVAAGASPAPPPGDYALLFDGDGVVEFDDPLPYSVESCTVEAWVRLDENNPRSAVYAVSDRGELGLDPADGRSWVMRHNKDASGTSKAGHYSAVDKRDPAALGRRVHVAGVYNREGFFLFVDGRLKGRSPPNPKNDRQFTLGKRPPQIGSQFKGVIDEVRISKSVRYTADFTPGARHEPDADTLALYHCDEGAGKLLVDASGNNRHGRIVSAKWVQADGSPIHAGGTGHYALEFSGSEGANDLAMVDSLTVDPTKPLTVEAYVRLATDFQQRGKFPIVGFLSHFAIHQSRQTGNPVLSVGHHQDLKFPYFQLEATADPGPERMTHLAALWHPDKVQLFVDGKLAGEKAEKLPGAGQRFGVFTMGRGFPGRVDEIRVSQAARYDRDFTPQPRFEPDADTLVLYHCDEGTGNVLRDASGNNHHVPFRGAKFVPADPATIKTAVKE